MNQNLQMTRYNVVEKHKIGSILGKVMINWALKQELALDMSVQTGQEGGDSEDRTDDQRQEHIPRSSLLG